MEFVSKNIVFWRHVPSPQTDLHPQLHGSVTDKYTLCFSRLWLGSEMTGLT